MAAARRWARTAGIALPAAAVALVACGGSRPDDRRAIEERLRTRGTAEVVREAEAARYTPPADGRLTAAQVRMFLAVRERECRIREAAALAVAASPVAASPATAPAAAAPGRDAPAAAPADHDRAAGREAAMSEPTAPSAMATSEPMTPSPTPDRAPPAGGAGAEALGAAADMRAAQELHANPKEYDWVRERVLEAETAATALALYQKMTAGREQLLAHKRKELETMTDPEARAAAQRDMEDWRRALQGSEPSVPPAVRANMALLAHYRAPLARLHALEERALAASAGLDGAAGAGAPR